MENEVRFYFSKSKIDDLKKLLISNDELSYCGRFYEKTVQLDHPMKEHSFYSKEVDGRFRIRISKNDEVDKCKVSWKRRVANTSETDINKEEEIEIVINSEEYEDLMFLFYNVLHMKRIESYERYRSVFETEEVEIALDEYPFGIALEIEAKKTCNNPESVIKRWLDKLGLDIKNRYPLSWDDKYTELCREQSIKPLSDVLFDQKMPEVN